MAGLTVQGQKETHKGEKTQKEEPLTYQLRKQQQQIKTSLHT